MSLGAIKRVVEEATLHMEIIVNPKVSFIAVSLNVNSLTSLLEVYTHLFG